MDERTNHRPDNPYTYLEGYRVNDASGEEVGEIEDTVYDAPSDVLKYVVVRGRPIPAFLLLTIIPGREIYQALTCSQSSPTTSALSAYTVSVPAPHSTVSLTAG